MNIVIDGQILQTDAWHRGMGKYTLQLLQSASKDSQDGKIKISILFNTNIECEDARYETVKYLCPEIEQIFHSLPLANSSNKNADKYQKELDGFMESTFGEEQVTFVITSLFTFHFYALFPKRHKKALLFYDLTPFLFWRDLGGYFPPELYMKRFNQIIEADLILSISETTRKDLLSIFGLPRDKVVNINGGFSGITPDRHKPAHFKVPKKYVLFPTGDLPHKNNLAAVKGFNEFNKKYDNSVKLLVTSSFSDSSIGKIHKLSKNVIFTGNVSDEELSWLYANSQVVLFASKYEGLGIPMLDAVANSKPVVASRIPVFQEMSKEAFYYFQYDEPSALAAALNSAYAEENFEHKVKLYPSIIKKYTWDQTAKEFLKAINVKRTKAIESTLKKEKIAIVSLHPGIADSLGRICEPLHANICDDFEIDYYFDPNGYSHETMQRPTYLDQIDTCNVYDINHLTLHTYRNYSAILYILDEFSFPSRAAQRAAVMPGLLMATSLENLKGTDLYFADLVVKNNTSIDVDTETDDISLIADKIKRSVMSRNSTIAENIIRQGGTNRSIIKRLLKVEK